MTRISQFALLWCALYGLLFRGNGWTDRNAFFRVISDVLPRARITKRKLYFRKVFALGHRRKKWVQPTRAICVSRVICSVGADIKAARRFTIPL